MADKWDVTIRRMCPTSKTVTSHVTTYHSFQNACRAASFSKYKDIVSVHIGRTTRYGESEPK